MTTEKYLQNLHAMAQQAATAPAAASKGKKK
jgi:hypothetical protein